MDQQSAIALLQRYREGKCSAAENELVEAWYNQLQQTGSFDLSDDAKTALRNVMESRLLAQINNDIVKAPAPAKLRLMQPRQWRIAAAAAAAVLLAGIYWIANQKDQHMQNTVAKTVPKQEIKAPAASKAMVILANGQQVYLDDSSRNGQLAQQGNVKLVRLPNGELTYQAASGETNAKPEYNTLVNPRGSQIATMILSDGSKVWLNAGSSITYPVAFTGNERNVKIEGEAYFEVAHNAAMPFRVSNGDIQVQVLGTHFNINAYPDEADIKVTLLEGSVKLVDNNNKAMLKPGQQGRVVRTNATSTAQAIKVLSNVDIDRIMAWKNGLFDFQDATLQEVMRQLERWYDIDVAYEKNIPKIEFVGKMGKDLTLQEVLRGLELSKVHSKIDGRKVTIMP